MPNRCIAFDTAHESARTSLTALLEQANKAWHGVKLHQPDWGEHSHSVALSAELRSEGLFFHFILNAFWKPLDFELPKGGHGTWRRWVDTYLDSPDDILPWPQAPPWPGDTYRAGDRSIAILYAHANR